MGCDLFYISREGGGGSYYLLLLVFAVHPQLVVAGNKEYMFKYLLQLSQRLFYHVQEGRDIPSHNEYIYSPPNNVSKRYGLDK